MLSKNIIFTAPKTVEVREEPVPEISGIQFLIRSEYSLISTGTECICLNGEFDPGTHWDNWVKYPFYPGYNLVGIVEKVGEEARNFKVGDRVAARCQHRQLVVAHDAPGARNSLVPTAVEPEDAAWFGMASIAQTGIRRGAHELGDAVVVIGAGLLGQFVTQYLRLMGAREIIVIDFSPARLEMARRHGATQTLQTGVAEAREAVWDLTGGRGADMAYDITGHPAVFAPALGLVRRFGKLVLLGDSPTPSQQHLTSDVLHRGVQVVGVHDGYPLREANDYFHWTADNMTALFFTYLERGQMQVNDLVTHRYFPDQAPETYEMLLTDRSAAMGVIFNWR